MKSLWKSSLFLSVGVLLFHASIARAQTMLTNDSVLKMLKAGLAEDVVLNMINLQPSQFSLTPDEMIAMKKDGVSDKIIAAMVGKGQPSSISKTNGTPPASASPSSPDSTAALDVGVYFKKKDDWVEVLPEVVNWKTGGFLKNVASGGTTQGRREWKDQWRT